jgi:ribosomal protein S18 acetylase RimI-like enzyme
MSMNEHKTREQRGGSGQNSVDLIRIDPATESDLDELTQLFEAYRIFYQESPAAKRASVFLRERLLSGVPRYFLARYEDARMAMGFMHMIPGTNTLAMRPMWFLEDLYVDARARRQGVGAALLRYAETFARANGAERITLATAHNNDRAQSLYRSLGYVREEHFLSYHRMLD